MRNIRSREEWLSLFEQQQRSGLNKTQFCRQLGITRSAFSNARYRLFPSGNAVGTFVPALPPRSDVDTARLPPLLPAMSAPQLALSLSGATLTLPVDISPLWLATLLREMAS
ncbi:IS66 family insertion sequence element accessory protein TnpA [Hafnia alvei]|uniref:IS66 family insertion sequence element accessory protein TnpA n=1 Tax=Hafnia alvei TaxID=569 RepID=UPI0024A7AAF7|nr:hypothetical protein [Hafnia alvei]